MDNMLRKFAIFGGLGLLALSVYWSQDGFNFNLAGDSGYQDMALFAGYFLAVVVTILQFIFSSNFKELNSTLIFLGAIAYGYSMFTNYQGILHFQGLLPNKMWAVILAVFLDATAEPMIAWGFYVSREGDLISNVLKALGSSFNNIQQENKAKHGNQGKPVQNSGKQTSFKPEFRNLNPTPQKKSPGYRFDGSFLGSKEQSDDTQPKIRY